MSFRNNASAVVALIVVGAVVLWVLSSGTKQDQSADSYPESDTAIEATGPGPLVSSTPASEESEAIAATSDDGPVVAAHPAPVVWRDSALAFAEQQDADPALSRHLEVEMQRLIDSTLDRTKHDVQSVTCRRHRCQMILSDRTPSVDTNDPLVRRLNVIAGPMSATVPPVLRGASNADVRNPSTGASLKAQLEMVQAIRTEPSAIEFIFAFVQP